MNQFLIVIRFNRMSVYYLVSFLLMWNMVHLYSNFVSLILILKWIWLVNKLKNHKLRTQSEFVHWLFYVFFLNCLQYMIFLYCDILHTHNIHTSWDILNFDVPTQIMFFPLCLVISKFTLSNIANNINCPC